MYRNILTVASDTVSNVQFKVKAGIFRLSKITLYMMTMYSIFIELYECRDIIGTADCSESKLPLRSVNNRFCDFTPPSESSGFGEYAVGEPALT